MLSPRSVKHLLLAAASLLLSLGAARAAIVLPDLIGDHMVVQRDKELPVWGSATPGSKLTVRFDKATVSVVAASDGTWNAKLPPLPAGGPYEMTISGDGELVVKDILVGDVWLAGGQSNMTFRMLPNPPWSEGVLDCDKEVAAANNPKLRFFSVIAGASERPETAAYGNWQTCTPKNVRFLSAVSYYFGRNVQEKSGVPIGIVVSARGATSIKSWMDRKTLEGFPNAASKIADADKIAESAAENTVDGKAMLPNYRAKYRQAIEGDGKIPSLPYPPANLAMKPAFLYNAMIAPLTRLPMKGFIWYQGEADAQAAKNYTALFKALIQSRRAQFAGPDAPFLFVQLANYDPVKARNLEGEKYDGTWAELRAAQARVLELPGTGMAVAADVGDPLKIHPRDKKTVGTRLAAAALNLAYGQTVPFRGPQVESARVDGAKLVLTMKVEGGTLRETPDPAGFELAGSDGVFHPASATLEGNTISVGSPEVPAPVRVRYAWANAPTLSIYDGNGLPASPFEVAGTAK